MAMKGLPSCSSTSKIVQMLGWCKAEAERASRRKPLKLGIVNHIVRQEFQGDEAVEFGVFGFVHHTHAAPAELLNDAIVRDGLADHAQACYGGRVGKSMKAVEFGPISIGLLAKNRDYTH